MGNALREQLLKAGLVNTQQVKKAVKEKHKEAQRQHGQIKSESDDQAQARIRQAQIEKVERDRLLNQQRQEQANKKAATAQIRQLVEQNRHPKGDGELPYNFADQGKIKRIYVSDSVRQQIALGQLAIVRLDKAYELVSDEIAEKIAARDADCVVLRNTQNRKTPVSEAKSDDPYSQYLIPDDLMW
ncbi:MAG: DUF2058 domain-containing protein [Methylococcaceae bacterium]|nr:DUF2058 domain-containing protein [Methylococcaceae bacterium]